MNQMRDMLIIIASVAVVIFVVDQISTKYNTDSMELSCINNDVENTLLEVSTEELKSNLKEQGFVLNTSVLRENTSTEKREFTIGGKSKYQCNTSIQLDLSAVLDNEENKKIIEKIANGKDKFTTTIDRDYSITENDLGTKYWVRALKIAESDLTSKFKN